MGVYAVGLELGGQRCLVVGGGQVASRKVGPLLEAGAAVTVVSPDLTPDLHALAQTDAIGWIARPYRAGDAAGHALVIAATNQEPVNRQVGEEARLCGIPVNVADRPDLGSFVVPGVVRQGSLTLAVFTGGQSPMLARRIREELQERFGPEYGELLDLLGRLRGRLQQEVPDQARRRAIYHALVYSDALELIRAGWREQVEARVEELLAAAREG